MTKDELCAWIEDLRGRLERGELANLPAVQLQPWCLIPNVEAFTRASLRSVDYWRSLPLEERRGDAPGTIQRRLSEELVLLHERLVEGKPCPPINYRTQR